jgi:hypothetical protein
MLVQRLLTERGKATEANVMKTLKILVALGASLFLPSCGPYDEADSGADDYGVIRQAYESNNSNELIGALPGRDLKLSLPPGMAFVGERLECGTGSCEKRILTGTSRDGTVTVKISRTLSTSPPVYEVLYQSGGSWLNLCQADTGPGAVPVRGSWTVQGHRQLAAGTFTFACEKTAAFKCKRAPFSYPDTSDHYQACTRMIRADYCGDGTWHTTDGERIDVADGTAGFSTRIDTEWEFEAAWNVDGAVCLGTARKDYGAAHIGTFPSVRKYLKDTCSRTSGAAGYWMSAGCDSRPFVAGPAGLLLKNRSRFQILYLPDPAVPDPTR